MSSSWIQVAFVIVAIAYWLGKYILYKCRGLPSGPLELPIVGSIPFLANYAHVKLAKMGKKYGGIFLVHFGLTPAVVVTDGDLIRDVLLNQGHNFIGRPDFFTLDATFKNCDIGFSYAKHWKDAKSCAKHILNQFGYNKNIMEPAIVNETQKLLDDLMQYDSQEVSLENLIFTHIFNVTWNMATGKSFGSDDPRGKKLKKDMFTVFRFIDPSSPLNFFPILRFVFPNSFYYKVGIKASDDIDKMIEEEISNHSMEISSNEPRTFIEAYLQEIGRRTEDERLGTLFNEKTLCYIVKDIMFGGTDTTLTTIQWTITYLTYYKGVQEKVQEELDRVIGPIRLPCYSDRYHLPYVTAVIMEVSRIASIVPFAVPHKCINTDVVGGYKIPVGMIVYPNLWAMHHDPVIWGDPEQFRPERFIDENGRVKESDYLLPFGAGPRVCMGMTFARLLSFIMITTIFQRFEFHPVSANDMRDPKTQKSTEGITLAPPPFSVILQKRVS